MGRTASVESLGGSTDRSAPAVVFVHGFQGDVRGTWGDFPKYLVEHPALERWSVLGFGYATSIAPDIEGIWSGKPHLRKLAVELGTFATADAALANRKILVLVAHSMGGLIVQRALLDRLPLRRRVQGVGLFGTPSLGLRKAWLLSFFNSQSRDMRAGGWFIRSLREEWKATFPEGPLFRFFAAAGDHDEFVGDWSSLDAFEKGRETVPGNHIEMVKPRHADDLAVRLVLGLVKPDLAAAREAERREFEDVVSRYMPNVGGLGDPALRDLLQALSGLSRPRDAFDVAARNPPKTGDVMGVVGGLYKRAWISGGLDADARRAHALYEKGWSLAQAADDPAQAHYHGINLCFLAALWQEDLPAAQALAREVLAWCGKGATRAKTAKVDEDARWRDASEGEALLHMRNLVKAKEAYGRALPKIRSPWEGQSMRLHATLISKKFGLPPNGLMDLFDEWTLA